MRPGPHRPSLPRRLLGSALAAALLVTVVAACSDGSAGATTGGPDLGTIEPGTIKVAYEPYAPYTSLEGDQLTGLDADILNAAAQKLNLRVEPVETDFPGMLASVQARRVDITIGGVAWTAERQKQGLFTDPPYYSPPAMGVRSGKQYATVGDLENSRLGTVTGYVWVKSIKDVPGAKLGAYPNAQGVFDDLGSGRIDVGFLDPLLIIYFQKQRPDLKIQTQYLTPPTDAEVKQHPNYEFFRPYMTSFYIPKQEPKLEQAISQEIRKMYASGEMAKLIQKWGGDPKQFLTPSPSMAKARQGVDRPQNWQPPSV
jgi:ABC-type amino acid transport substrate-binding protein